MPMAQKSPPSMPNTTVPSVDPIKAQEITDQLSISWKCQQPLQEEITPQETVSQALQGKARLKMQIQDHL